MVNDECVVALMNEIDRRVTAKNGRPVRINLHKLRLSPFPEGEKYTAAKYIADLGFINLDGGIDKNGPIHYTKSSPRHYHIVGITAKGQNFLKIINETALDKLKKFGLEKICQLVALGKTLVDLLPLLS